MARVPKAERERRVREAAEMLGLSELLSRKPAELSGGERQRAAMGRAIVRQPKVFLMDEPLSNLDAKLRVQMRGDIAGLQSRLGVTTLYVTHDQVEAMAMADRIALMQAGELLQVGQPAELYHRPATTDVADFFGTMNWLDGRVAAPGVAETAIGPLRFAAEAGVSADVLIGFRPECVALLADAAPEKLNVFSAALKASVFLGDQSLLTLALGDRVVSAKCRGVEVDGGPLRFRIDPADGMVFSAGRRLSGGAAGDLSAAHAAV
jgi:multiple sugar transport system ATP-binding protein